MNQSTSFLYLLITTAAQAECYSASGLLDIARGMITIHDNMHPADSEADAKKVMSRALALHSIMSTINYFEDDNNFKFKDIVTYYE